MKPFYLLAALSAAGALGAAASTSQAGNASARTGAQLRVIDRGGGVQVVIPLTLPAVSTITAPASLTGNGRLTIHGQADATLSMSVPSDLTLVRAGGSEALHMETTTLGVAGQGVMMGGAIINGSAMSVDIGGKLALASSDQLVPGPYEGLFVVVVQYN